MTNRTVNLALAGAFLSALAMASAGAQAGEDETGKEKCYGVSMAGKNDCASAGNNTCAGTSKIDFDKTAWKYVPKGTCESMEVKLKDGAKRKGSLTPIKG